MLHGILEGRNARHHTVSSNASCYSTVPIQPTLHFTYLISFIAKDPSLHITRCIYSNLCSGISHHCVQTISEKVASNHVIGRLQGQRDEELVELVQYPALLACARVTRRRVPSRAIRSLRVIWVCLHHVDVHAHCSILIWALTNAGLREATYLLSKASIPNAITDMQTNVHSCTRFSLTLCADADIVQTYNSSVLGDNIPKSMDDAYKNRVKLWQKHGYNPIDVFWDRKALSLFVVIVK
jgi:hypothetical protein